MWEKYIEYLHRWAGEHKNIVNVDMNESPYTYEEFEKAQDNGSQDDTRLWQMRFRHWSDDKNIYLYFRSNYALVYLLDILKRNEVIEGYNYRKVEDIPMSKGCYDLSLEGNWGKLGGKLKDS